MFTFWLTFLKKKKLSIKPLGVFLVLFRIKKKNPEVSLNTLSQHNHKWRYSANATITTNSPPKGIRNKEQIRKKSTHPSHETTDAKTKNNCNTGPALELRLANRSWKVNRLSVLPLRSINNQWRFGHNFTCLSEHDSYHMLYFNICIWSDKTE